MNQEHYDAQIEYSELLFEFLEIPNWNLIKKVRALSIANKFKKSHRKCCEWANYN